MKRMVTSLGVLQIFFSLLLVIAIMFVSNYFVYRNSISDIYEKVSQNNALGVKSIVQTFDSNFRQVNNLIYSIHGLSPSDRLTSSNGKVDMSKVYTLVENLSALVASTDFIEEAIVFYDDSDLAISSRGTSSFSYFFNKKYKHPVYNADYWRTYSRAQNEFKMFPADNYTLVSEANQQQRTKRLLVAVGGNKVRMSTKNVMILIDAAAFMRHVNEKLMIPGSSLIALDNARNTIFSTDKNLDLIEVLNDVYFNAAQQEVSLTRENFEYNIYKSEYNGYLYINKVPYQFQNINSVTEANLMIMLTAIVSAVLLSVFLSFYLNRPVNNILRLLGGGYSKGNDFRKIYSGIVKLQSENESLRKQTAYADAELRRGVFLQALDGVPRGPEHDVQTQAYARDFFRGKHFVMLLLHARPEEGGDVYTPRSVEELEAALKDGFARESLETFVAHTADLQFVVLVGLDSPGGRERLLRRVRSALVRIEKEHCKGFAFWACASKLYTSEIAHCHPAYREVVNGSLYRGVNEKEPVLDVEQIRYVWSVYYPFEKMEKLSNYLLSGKVQEAVLILKEMMKENADRNIHHHQLVHIAKTAFFYMLRHTEGGANTNRELYRLEQEFMRKAESALDYKEIEEALIDVAGRLARLDKAESKSKLHPAFISQYIELHYMENLYLDHIAEVLGTTPKYFSNYFKKTFGVNYVEYVNKVRLTHAKELLKDTNLSIAEIGERTGYLNSSTFTTTFRKYFGCSPSEYRKQLVS